MNTIALVEINGSHDECLLSQLHILHQRKCRLLLVTNTALIERNPDFYHYVDDVLLVDFDDKNKHTKRTIKRIWCYLKAHNTDTVVLNTAHGKRVRMLCMKALFNPMRFVGIAHVMRAFQVSTTQKLINLKVSKYLTLSEHLLSADKLPKRIPIEYFYPMRFYTSNKQIAKPKPRIVIVGSVENARKDLDGCVTMVQGLDSDVEFVFLGKSDSNNPAVVDFHAAVKAADVAHMVHTFDHFVDSDTFDAYLQSADLILPLVHPNTPSAKQFFKNQIPGAMLIAFSYKIPLLIHQAYQHIAEMQEAAFYYQLDTFAQVLSDALSHSAPKKRAMQENQRFDIAYHEARFADYVLGHNAS